MLRPLCVSVALVLTTGCAQFFVMRHPGPIPRELLAVDADRSVVIGALGAPVSSEPQPDGMLRDLYRYQDGGAKNSAVSKTLRVVLYTAGDVFTVFLDQIIWMPLELAFNPTEYVATVDYVRRGDRWVVRWLEEREAGTGRVARIAGELGTGAESPVPTDGPGGVPPSSESPGHPP